MSVRFRGASVRWYLMSECPLDFEERTSVGFLWTETLLGFDGQRPVGFGRANIRWGLRS